MKGSTMEHMGYSVYVGNGTALGDGRIGMHHRSQYILRLWNHHDTPCDATLRIDDKEIGTFRIEGHGAISIERPPQSDGRFTFFQLGSKEASAAGLTDSDSLGLISVKFTPGIRRPACCSSHPEGMARGMSFGGGTGLTGHSAQGFSSATAIELNHAEAVIIHLRLVPMDSSDVRPLVGIGRETPVPPKQPGTVHPLPSLTDLSRW